MLGHGCSQSKDQHANQGQHLATRGYIALIPNFNAASDHSRFADDLRKRIDWIEARDSDTHSLFMGRVRADRVGAAGHSAGGFSAILGEPFACARYKRAFSKRKENNRLLGLSACGCTTSHGTSHLESADLGDTSAIPMVHF